MRLLRTKATILKSFLLAMLIFCSSCGRGPVWLPELTNLVEKSNRELEAVLPMLTQETSSETVYIGLRQLDKSTDELVNELAVFLEKYPDVVTEKIKIAFYLKKPLDKLGKNLREAFTAGIAWDKRIGREKEFIRLANNLNKKTRRVNFLFRAVLEPEYE